MDVKPIPALYVCYLLRSTRKEVLYIGSTPNPQRRLAQHNAGIAKGGAVRTSHESLHPWEVTCIVTGFPSNVAALQFEWAWQKTHLTLRVSKEDRQVVRKVVPEKGGKRKRSSCSRLTLDRGLLNLRILLGAPSFSRWPLEVLFFCDDVYEEWNRKGPIQDQDMYDEVRNVFRSPKKVLLSSDQNGLASIDASYSPLWPHLKKSLGLLADGIECQCSVCSRAIDDPRTVLTCLAQTCTMISHLTCLSDLFLEDKAGNSPVLPISGDCPCCKTRLPWIDLVKEASLRIRGPQTIDQLKRRLRRQNRKTFRFDEMDTSEPSSEKSDQDDATESDASGYHLEDHLNTDDEVANPFGESAWNDWHYIADEDDVLSNTDGEIVRALPISRSLKEARSKPSIPMVIEDSGE